jgi:hypothetical protein
MGRKKQLISKIYIKREVHFHYGYNPVRTLMTLLSHVVIVMIITIKVRIIENQTEYLEEC